MNGQLTEWGSSIAAFATAVSSLLQSPFAYVVFVLPALMAALVNRRGAAKLALLVGLAFVLAAAWLMSIEPGSRNDVACLGHAGFPLAGAADTR